jgi:hypothetical protein
VVAGRAREDRRVQPVDRPRALPTPPATRSVEAASAREAEKAMEEGPHGRENCSKRALKLLGMFGKIKAVSPKDDNHADFDAYTGFRA